MNFERKCISQESGLVEVDAGDADVFLVHCPDVQGIYAVPVAEASRSHMTLRVEPTANCQAKGVRWAADYALPA